MTSIYEKKKLAEVRLIHAEQMPLYNSIILGKKQWTQRGRKKCPAPAKAGQICSLAG